MTQSNNFCPYCLIAWGYVKKCGNCGRDTIGLSTRARIPKKNAHKKKWKELFDNFTHLENTSPKTKALKRKGIFKKI